MGACGKKALLFLQGFASSPEKMQTHHSSNQTMVQTSNHGSNHGNWRIFKAQLLCSRATKVHCANLARDKL